MPRVFLLLFAVLAGCGEPDVVGSISLRLEEPGILDEIDSLTLDVHDAEGLSCRTNGELEGSPAGDPIVRDLRLTVGEEASVTISAGERAFVVTGTASGERIAAGCTVESLRGGQTVSVEIAVHRLLHPGECGNGDLEASEECDDGNTTAGDGCDDACTTEEGTFPRSTASSQVAPGASGGAGGKFVVTWYDANPQIVSVKVGFRDAVGGRLAGGAGNDRNVNEQVRGDPSTPTVASSDAGAVVVWQDYSGSGADIPDIKAHFYGADSLPLDTSDVFGHEALDGAQERPAAAMMDSGIALLVWLDDRLTPAGVEGRVFDAGAAVGDDSFEVSTGQSASAVAVAATADGFLVAYAGDGIRVRVIDEDGTPGDDLEMDAAAGASAPAIATASDGSTSLVTWVQAGSVHGQIIRDGAAHGDAFDISTGATASAPAAAGGDGLFAIVWAADDDIVGRLLDLDGAPIFNRTHDDATAFPVNRSTDGAQSHPGVAIVDDLMLAVWQDAATREEDDEPSGIRFRYLSVSPP